MSLTPAFHQLCTPLPEQGTRGGVTPTGRVTRRSRVNGGAVKSGATHS